MARRILMVDDDELILESTGKFLTLSGWLFDSSNHPDGALDKARAFHPDLILMDVQMPGQSGWELCAEFKKTADLRHIPVIMLSGARMSPQDKAKGIEIGCDDYLSKPFDLPILMLKIDAILRVAES